MKDKPANKYAGSRHDLAERAKSMLEHHPFFHHRTDCLHFAVDEDRLIVSGKLPSFYLKQSLQEALRKMDGVSLIDNQVVVCSTGIVE